MTCYRPQPAYQVYNWLPNGGDHIGWSRPRLIYPVERQSDGSRVFPDFVGDTCNVKAKRLERRLISLPCGLCFGCRIDNARSWSLRMMHETRYHDHNYFVTLTYAPEHMPAQGNLDYSHLRNFFKKARHVFQTESRSFKYFACGEYGDKTFRPHFHFAGFSFQIPDLRHFRRVGNHDYFLSDALRDCWSYGHVVVGDLSYDSAAYIARYVTKKMHGQNVRSFGHDLSTGEVYDYTIERAFQSKGLGVEFYEQHKKEIWDLDGCLYNGQYLVQPPRYYFKRLEREDPVKAADIKAKRLEKAGVSQFVDNARDKELLYTMQARRLQMQTLQRSL